MPRNGVGQYNFPASSWSPAVNGVTATSADYNGQLSDLAAAVTQSVSRDGQSPMTGNLPMGNNRITGLAAGVASTDAATVGQLPTVNVKLFGAVGNGVNDDTAAIQAAINYAKTKGWQRRPGVPGSQQGGVVYFPSGAYLISSPLILPRSGLFDGYAVALVGETMTSSVILGAETFPSNRGMVEWEAVASRVYYQAFQDLTFLLPRTVTGVNAVKFVPVNGTTTASLFLEAMHGLLMRRIEVDATNTVNSHGIRFDGYVRFSRFETIRANFAPGGSPTLNTVLLQFPENTGTTASIFGESNGAGYCTFEGIYGMGEQGGSGTIMRGRFYECVADQVLCGNNTLNNQPSIAIIKSLATRFTELNCEGGTIQLPGEVQIQDSEGITISELGLGGSGAVVGLTNGISLVNSRNCLIDGRYTATGTPPFSTNGGKAIVVDANCKNNTFRRFYLNAAVTAEVDIQAPASARNVVEWFNPTSGLSGDIGLRPGALLAVADSNVVQNIPTGVFTPLIFGNETLDPMGIYNPLTGAITVPVSGRYRITVVAQIGAIVASKQLDLNVSVNGAAGAYINRVFTGSETFDLLNGSVVFNAVAGQSLAVGINHNFGANATMSQFASTANITFEFVD